MKEIPRRKTVTSSLDEISTNHLGKRVVVREGGIILHPPFYSRLGQIFKDDGTVFSSISIFTS
jgi:hypothetical protein